MEWSRSPPLPLEEEEGKKKKDFTLRPPKRKGEAKCIPWRGGLQGHSFSDSDPLTTTVKGGKRGKSGKQVFAGA